MRKFRLFTDVAYQVTRPDKCKVPIRQFLAFDVLLPMTPPRRSQLIIMPKHVTPEFGAKNFPRLITGEEVIIYGGCDIIGLTCDDLPHGRYYCEDEAEANARVKELEKLGFRRCTGHYDFSGYAPMECYDPANVEWTGRQAADCE
jgi:hypothetical protein